MQQIQSQGHQKINKNAQQFRKNRTSQRLVQIGGFQIKETISRDNYSKTKLAYHSQIHQKALVRIIFKEKVRGLDKIMAIKKGLLILKMIYHRNALTFYQITQTEKYLFVFTQHLDQDYLMMKEYIKKFGKLDSQNAFKVFYQVLKVVKYFQSLGIIIRNLNYETIKINSKMQIKVIDFSQAILKERLKSGKNESITFQKTVCNLGAFLPPQTLDNDSYLAQKVDIWSLGIFLYYITCGKLPFYSKSALDLFNQVKRGIFSLPQHLQSDIADLIDKILRISPSNRYSISEIQTHPWIFRNKIIKINNERVLDEKALIQVKQFYEFDRKYLQSCLQFGNHNQVTVLYKLIADRVDVKYVQVNMPDKNFPTQNMPAKVKGYPQNNLNLSLTKNFTEQSKKNLDEAIRYQDIFSDQQFRLDLDFDCELPHRRLVRPSRHNKIQDNLSLQSNRSRNIIQATKSMRQRIVNRHKLLPIDYEGSQRFLQIIREKYHTQKCQEMQQKDNRINTIADTQQIERLNLISIRRNKNRNRNIHTRIMKLNLKKNAMIF